MRPLDSTSLRKHLRNNRKNLTVLEQTEHSELAFQHVKHLLESNSYFRTPKKIALFLSQDGELSTQKTIQHLWENTNHQVYLPVLETRDEWHMAFVQYTNHSEMIANQFGIQEPSAPLNKHLSGEAMNWVFMPLVGFDKQGNRLGMGGGYYDRTFEFKLHQKQSSTKLIGWAHECQRVETLPAEPWDVPLDGILTEKGFKLF
ncbi:5-formyltetrahydrofolate cyclo-ligase [Thiomicrorhabdus sp. Kp2]|uniref:5-formyltetrahydrofolate cyclo-ligase n=1 Tax=Thiomicrorhabdus sp. Kp2 TaxID=1123518 RepID=UPI0004283B18|nr:5-formyltetrahydrofolate cyclo-ligase [Thiomicrorhabdus sp. Kp2]